MVEKSPRPKARPQTPKESKPSAPEKSLRPKTREQVRVEDEMRQFGNLEFRADMEDQLSWNPLARLGFEPDLSVVGRPAYNSPRIYEGIRYDYDAEQEYIDETLPRAASGAEYRDIVGRVKPGSVIVNSNTAKNPVWSHEYTHGGLEKVMEYLDEDRDFFTEKYGEDTVKLLDEIRSDTDRSEGPNEKLTEMLDDVSKDLEVDLEGNLIPAAGTALGKMDNTRTAVEDWAASPTSRSMRSRRTLQEYLKLGRVKDEKLHKSDIESAFPGYVGIFEAAEDMLEAQGEPLPTEKRGWLKRTLSKMGFDEGGLATQTKEAFTNPSDRLMSQSDERKLGAGLTSLEFEADMMPLLKKDPIAMLGYKASMPNRRFPSIQKLTGNNTPLYYDVSENPIGPNYNPSSDKVSYGRDYGSSKDVILHELRHRGLKILDERYKEKDSFIADYGDMAHRLLDKAETSGTKSNEFVAELYDNPDATYIKPGDSGSKNTIGYVADSLQFVDPKGDTQIMPDVADELLGLALTSEDHDEYRSLVGRDSLSKEEIEVGKSGLNKAAIDLLNEIDVLGFDEGGLAQQTEEALGWTAEGKKFADANPVEVKENQQSTALSIADVPVFDRPMDASESDKWTGVQDELGNRQYKTIFGRTYWVRLAEDQRSNYEKIQQDIIPVVKNYLDNPTAPSKEQTIDFLKQSLGAAWETFKIPGDLAAGNKGMEDVTLGNIFELAGGTGSASTVGKVPGGDSSNTMRTFGGSNPPTYNPRKNLLSSQREVDEFFDSVIAPQEYIDLRNTEFVLFREPISEFAETVSIPKKGLLGSEFLNLIKKNDSIPETSLQEGIIDPQKRYSREELLSAVGKDSRGLFANIANIASDKPKSYENYQRQIRDAGFIGGMEIEYFDIPISSNIGYPGKNFKANDQHYSDDTLVHVRGSIIDPSQSDLSVPTLSTPDQNFVMDVQGENYLLVEEIQSDLLTKGYLKPGNEFDRLFKQSTESWGNQNQVAYSEIFGSVDKEIKSIIKELVKEGVKSPSTVDAFRSVQELNSKYSNRGFILSTELTEVLDDLSAIEGSTLLDLDNFVKDLLGDNKEDIVNFDTAETIPVKDFFKSYKYVPHKQRREEYLDKLQEKLRKKKINKEVYRIDLDELYSGFLTYSYRFDQDNTDYGLPPIRKNKQAVDEALKVLIAKAAQSDVEFIVIPPAERIALARGRDLKKDKGDRFYRTYVTDLEKSLSELEDNYPVKIFNAELPYKRHEKFVGFVPDMGDSINTGTSNTGTIIDISELVDKYKVEEPRQFAQGGVVNDMNRQMNLFSRGGLGDDGMQRDPVSGNEIPPGSLAEEVRDDIPAQLSEGEYVVPADVVRFFGVKYFEDLRAEAKMGLQGMEADGRIGGEPVGMPMAQASNPNEITEEDLAQLEQMLSTGVANGGLMDKIAIAAKTDKVINDRMNANGMVVGYATGGEVTAPTASYADPTRVDAVINKVMATLQQKPELVQELSKRGIQISRTNPSMQAGQMNQANPPAETRKAFAIGGMPMDTSYMTPTGLPSWASVPGSSYTYQGPGVPDATGQIPGTATPDTTPAAATNAADACKAMGMGYDPATGTCILVDSGDSGPTTAPEPAEFKWEEPDVNYFEMSEEELAAIGTGAKIDPFMKKLALGASVVAGPLGLLIGGYNAYQQGKSISEVRSAALVAKARGFDDLAETLSKQADDLVGKSRFLTQAADKFGGLSGSNDFFQQIAAFSPEGFKLDEDMFKDDPALQKRYVEAVGKAMETRYDKQQKDSKFGVTTAAEQKAILSDPAKLKEARDRAAAYAAEKASQASTTVTTNAPWVSNNNNDFHDDMMRAVASSRTTDPSGSTVTETTYSTPGGGTVTFGADEDGAYRGGLMKKRKKK